MVPGATGETVSPDKSPTLKKRSLKIDVLLKNGYNFDLFLFPKKVSIWPKKKSLFFSGHFLEKQEPVLPVLTNHDARFISRG